MSLDDARRKCEAWRRYYNEERPHIAIGNKASTARLARRHNVTEIGLFDAMYSARALRRLKPWRETLPPAVQAIYDRELACTDRIRGASIYPARAAN
jgi:hypothetical protein